MPVEELHTKLLHICTKGNNVRAVKKAKSEILARVKAYNTSGFKIKMYGNVCRHFKSFVGRDFKGWTQMAMFIV